MESPNWDDTFTYARITYDGETDLTGNFVNECIHKYLGLDYKDVYFTNSVLYLPKKNQHGKHEVRNNQIINCAFNIKKVINCIDPRIIVTMGIPALKASKKIQNHTLPLNLNSVAKRTEWYGRILFPMAHPSLLGRLPQNRNETLQRRDFMQLGRVMNVAIA